MVRKVNYKSVPKRQRWLYEILEFGPVKVILLIWLICWVILGLAMVALKWFVNHFK